MAGESSRISFFKLSRIILICSYAQILTSCLNNDYRDRRLLITSGADPENESYNVYYLKDSLSGVTVYYSGWNPIIEKITDDEYQIFIEDHIMEHFDHQIHIYSKKENKLYTADLGCYDSYLDEESLDKVMYQEGWFPYEIVNVDISNKILRLKFLNNIIIEKSLTIVR